ncbi:MAG: hypothetical protein E7214_04560 [Clostridium sp.]|nr:hypothetical protein [Clostridium sp.]
MMISKFKRRILTSEIATTLLITMIPSWVFAAEEVVSEENLRDNIADKVDKLDFEYLGIGKILNNINIEVTNRVIESINKHLKKDDIEILTELQIEEIFKSYRNDVSLDKIIANGIVSKVLTSEFLEEIVTRTIEYSVLKVMNNIKVSSIEENIQGDKSMIIDSIVDEIFNSSKKNILYYDYQMGKRGIKVLGWKESPIENRVTKEVNNMLKNLEELDQDRFNLDKIEYEIIVLDSTALAVENIIKEKINSIKYEIDKVA